MSILLEALKKAQEEKVLRSSLSDMPDITSEQTKALSSSESEEQISEEDLAILLSRTQISKNTPQESSVEAVQQTHAEQIKSDDLNTDQSEPLISNSLKTKDKDDSGDFGLPELTLSEFQEGDEEENSNYSNPASKEEGSNFLDEGAALTLAISDAPLSQEEAEEETDEASVENKEADHLDSLLQLDESVETSDDAQEKESLSVELNSLLHQAEEVNDHGVEAAILDTELEKKEELPLIESDSELKLDVPTQTEDSNKDKVIAKSEFEKADEEVDATGEHADASYDWSLSQIPGFDTDSNVSEPEVKKARESKNFISLFKRGQESKPDYQKKKVGFKKWLMLSVAATTFLSVAGYLGWEYSKILQTDVTSEVVDYQNILAQIRQETSKKPEIKSQEENSITSKAPAENSPSENKAVIVAAHSLEASSKNTKLSPSAPAEGGVKTIASRQQKPKSVVQIHSKLQKKQGRQKTAPAKPVSKPSRGVQIQSQIVKDIRLQAYEAFEKGDYVKAQQLYSRAALKHPKDINVWLGLGASSLKLDERGLALKYYQQALKLDPSNADALKALAMLTPKKVQNWEEQIKRLQAQQSNDPDLYFILGGYYSKHNDWLQAEKYFKKAAELSPSSADILFNYAVTLDHLGRFQMAKRFYQKALAADNGQLSSASLKSIKNRIQLLEQFLLKTQQSSR